MLHQFSSITFCDSIFWKITTWFVQDKMLEEDTWPGTNIQKNPTAWGLKHGEPDPHTRSVHQHGITCALLGFSEGLEIHPGTVTCGMRARRLLFYRTVVTPIHRHFFWSCTTLQKSPKNFANLLLMLVPTSAFWHGKRHRLDEECVWGRGGLVEIFKYTVVGMCVSRAITLKYATLLFFFSE